MTTLHHGTALQQQLKVAIVCLALLSRRRLMMCDDMYVSCNKPFLFVRCEMWGARTAWCMVIDYHHGRGTLRIRSENPEQKICVVRLQVEISTFELDTFFLLAHTMHPQTKWYLTYSPRKLQRLRPSFKMNGRIKWSTNPVHSISEYY